MPTDRARRRRQLADLLDRLDHVAPAARLVALILGRYLPPKDGVAAWAFSGMVDDPGVITAVLNALAGLDRLLYPATYTDPEGRVARLPYAVTLGDRARLIYPQFIATTGKAPLLGKAARRRYRGTEVARQDLLGPTPVPPQLGLAACALQRAHDRLLAGLPGAGPRVAGEPVPCTWRWPDVPAVPPQLLRDLEARAEDLEGAIARCRTTLTPRPPRRAAQPRTCRLALRGGAAYLDGEAVPLDDLTADARAAALCFLGHLIRANGNYVSSGDIDRVERGKPGQGLAGSRWDRVRKGLPEALLALTESSRHKGYRLAARAWGVE
jgi:hypothetical protein